MAASAKKGKASSKKTPGKGKLKAIQQRGGQYYVHSRYTGKKLSKGYKSKKAALKRMAQIVYFKHGGKFPK